MKKREQEEFTLSLITKKALADSLKKQLLKKPLDKITITDITEDCGLNRMTFYYHFKDIYDLLEWGWVQEAEKLLKGKKEYATWQQGFFQIFQTVQENKSLVMSVYRTTSRERLEEYLYKMTYELLINVVEEKSQGMNVRDADKRFIADFYKYAFVGIMLDWIKNGMKEDPEEIIEHLSVLIKGDFTKALNKYRLDEFHQTNEND